MIYFRVTTSSVSRRFWWMRYSSRFFCSLLTRRSCSSSQASFRSFSVVLIGSLTDTEFEETVDESKSLSSSVNFCCWSHFVTHSSRMYWVFWICFDLIFELYKIYLNQFGAEILLDATKGLYFVIFILLRFWKHCHGYVSKNYLGKLILYCMVNFSLAIISQLKI